MTVDVTFYLDVFRGIKMVEHSNNNIRVPNDDDGDAKPLSLVYLFGNN